MHGMDEAAAEVIALEVALLQPGNRADGAFLRRVLHPDFVEFGSSGRVWTVETITSALAADPGTAASDATGFTPLHVSDKAILLTYRTPHRLRSSLWLFGETTGWQLRFHQGTPSEKPDVL
jgi:ribonuclease HI